MNLSDTERKALKGLLSNLEYEAGDVHDVEPDEDNEDAFWAYQQWHAVYKLITIAEDAESKRIAAGGF
jgi:hypothetical protein